MRLNMMRRERAGGCRVSCGTCNLEMTMKFLTRGAVLVGLSSTLVVSSLAKNAFAAPGSAHRVLDARVVRVAAPQNARATRANRVTANRATTPLRLVTPVRVAQNNAQLASFERDMAQSVNAERRNVGLPPLLYDESLAQVARAHALEMRNRNYFAHESPTANLRHPQDRYRVAFGRIPAMIAENVYREWGSPRQVTFAQVERGHASLMNSPGHRANILDGRVRRIGIGIVVNARGDIWITQMFSRLTW